MGPRAAPGPGRGRPAAPGLQLIVARGPAAGRGRSRGPHTGDKPAARAGQPASRTGKPASRADQPAARADKAASRTGTPRGPRQGQRAPARGSRGGTGGGSGRRIDPARLVAFEVLRAVRERVAYANLLLPALLRERGLTGRD